MTEQIYSESLRKVIQNIDPIESSLKVKIETKGHVVLITGEPANEKIAVQVIEALNLGFSIAQALDLKQDDSAFEKILIKSLSRRNDLSQVRGRLIGVERKVLRTIEDLTGAEIVVHENTVGIIGMIEAVKKASFAVKRIIMGSKHANVYAWLEQQIVEEKEKF